MKLHLKDEDSGDVREIVLLQVAWSSKIVKGAMTSSIERCLGFIISAIVKQCTLTLFLVVMVTQYLQRATFVKIFFQLNKRSAKNLSFPQN